MLPLSIFLVIWLVLLGFYGLAALFSVIQMVRFGIAGAATYVSTAIYMGIAGLVIAACLLYFLTVDWSAILDVGGIVSFGAIKL